jgi:hypothetical protein
LVGPGIRAVAVRVVSASQEANRSANFAVASIRGKEESTMLESRQSFENEDVQTFSASKANK